MSKCKVLLVFISFILLFSFSCGSSDDGFPLGNCKKACEKVFDTCQITYINTIWGQWYQKFECDNKCNTLDYAWEDYDKEEQLEIKNWISCLYSMSCESIKEQADLHVCY